ncbi:MAG TPA: DegT/DnrJ/EryC1/StrS family aminotransferase [Solidesulfovibrio magneticus]|nr:DegT/DnrJ/EryC1/StrS family aminotransferase [Solidesulfovibrio magneticus]
MFGKVNTRPRIAVVVPVYGNEASLPELYERIVAASDKANIELTLQFVNDRSPDNSQAVLEALAEKDPRVRVILLSRNHGSFVAIAAGLAEVAGHDAAIILSADLQDPPETIPEMADRWREGNRVVLCVRAERDDPLASRLFSEAFHWLFRRIALKEMPPGGFDFCLIDRAVIKVILESAEKKTSLVGLILWAGFDRAVVKYERAARKHGKSMWSLGRKLSYALHSIVAFSSFPIKLLGTIGVLLALLSLGGVAYILIALSLGIISSPGWASMMLSQLVTIAAMFLGFGVLGGYLWIDLEQTRKRPLFVIEKRSAPAGEGPRTDGRVLFFNMRGVSAPVSRELNDAALQVLRSPQTILGPAVERFEREFASWAGAKHCVGVANGTDAITLALWAAGVEPGSTVAVPALTAPPTAVGVLRAGCALVFVDVDPHTLTLDPAGLQQAAALGATAVVPVHLYGIPCAMVEIMDASRRLGLTVVEDCAQSTGSSLNGTACGLFGRASAFSFYPTKNLGCYGDGGAVFTDDAALAERLRQMRCYGQDATGECVMAGFNSRLDELQAALLSARLRVLDAHNAARQRIAALYDRELQFLNPVPGPVGRVPHLYVVRPWDRDGFRSHLKARGVDTGVHYPLALTRHAYLAANSLGGPCPVAEAAASQVVSLPCHPGMHLCEAERVVVACRDWPGAGKS